MSPLLDSVRVFQFGGRAAAVCAQLFAELGADVLAVHRPGEHAELPAGEALVFAANRRHLTIDPASAEGRESLDRLIRGAQLIVIDLPAHEFEEFGLTPDRLLKLNPAAVLVSITPFGLSGSRRDYLGGDLVAFHASGIARLLVGHVEDIEAEPPVRAAGEQSDFVVGLTAACAAMNGIYQWQRSGVGQVIDVSAQEAMSLMAARELAMPGFGGQPAARDGFVQGGNAVVTVLPARDGYVLISPREVAQWRSWLHLLGDPAWGSEPRFATRAERLKNFTELYELLASWSRPRSRAEITELCQEHHVPCFPSGVPGDMLHEPQVLSRSFFAPLERPGADAILIPRPPFGLPQSDYVDPVPGTPGTAEWRARAGELKQPGAAPAATLPLDGVRVLDFSWVIAGPTVTRYLALMGAEVIKVESPDLPDTGRVSELHDVLGQSKLAFSMNVKAPGALDAIKRLVAVTDVVVENFATGVMERLGLGYEDLRALRPDIIMLSSSGLGRTGPRANWVAYGSLLSTYAGFLDESAERAPRSGLAWADPLCGLFMDFAVVAALRERDLHGAGRHIDFSMLEGLLWTMPNALIGAQIPGMKMRRAGNADPDCVPYDVFRCTGADRWLAIAVTQDAQWRVLCGIVPALADLQALSEDQRREQRSTIDAALAAWAQDRDAFQAMELLQAAGVPASASYTTNDMFGDTHLWDRKFYKMVTEPNGTERFLPGLPWRWGDDSRIDTRAAPGEGQDNEHVLRNIIGLSPAEIAALEAAGAFAKTR